MREIKTIVVHHSASLKATTSYFDIERWHTLDRGYMYIGYHYVIDMHGTIYEGRALHLPGAHCYGHNKNSIGICVIGDFTKENPTPEQLLSLTTLIDDLLYRFPDASVKRHSDLSKTLCPGPNLVF